jgi:hypothetical protein
MANESWIEILKCPRCGKTGLAEVSYSDAYEGHDDSVSPGFRIQYDHRGVAFYCVGCEVEVSLLRE